MPAPTVDAPSRPRPITARPPPITARGCADQRATNPRHDADPAHAWLRDCLRDLMAQWSADARRHPLVP
ncbi:hypothetical protein [Streptomyces sp. NPDC046197]|uniref:hypothetical protein n=1 Tax=Streptomyces sp. NPDC046197 TaxID=3154337 RepID=UPI0033CCD935